MKFIFVIELYLLYKLYYNIVSDINIINYSWYTVVEIRDFYAAGSF